MSDLENSSASPISDDKKEPIKFHKLTPIIDKELAEPYKEALDFIFTEKDVTNIAITGSYGSGKTSIIKSYEDHFHKKSTGKEFTYISLASFDMPPNSSCDPKENNSVKDETNFNASLHYLEEKVLNHLVHQISPEKIPLSHFKIYRTSSNQSAIYIAIYSILLLVTSYLVNDWIINKNHLENSHFSTILTAPFFPWFTPIALFFPFFLFLKLSWLVLFAWLTLLGFGIYYLALNLQNYRIRKKISVDNFEIELFDEPNDSRFDKYMNEIIYIFEEAKIETVIIEDLDRFDQCSPHLFTRLRELNLLLNKRQKTNGKEPIRFLYLIRDDIFTTENRTKFFDFILPIVPVITYHNSFEKAFDLLKPFNIDTALIDELTSCINDLRLIKNIINEFHIYHKVVVSKAVLNSNKLLALIAYKNLFPEDFSLLLNKKGFLYDLFQIPLIHQSEKEQIIHEAIKSLHSKSKQTEKVLYDQIDELFTSQLTKHQGFINFADPPSKITKSFVTNLRLLDQVMILENKKHIIINFDDLCNKLREQAVFIKNDYSTIKKKLLENRDTTIDIETTYIKQKEMLPSLKLAHLISIEKIRSIYLKSHLAQSTRISTEKIVSLFYFLTKEHYINETYLEYLNNFYTSTVSENDKLFLRGLIEKVDDTHKLELESFDIFLPHRTIADFNRTEILNYSLLTHLLDSADKYGFLPYFLKTMARPENKDFCEDYFLSDTCTPPILVLLFKNLAQDSKDIFEIFAAHKQIRGHQKAACLLSLIDQEEIPLMLVLGHYCPASLFQLKEFPEHLDRKCSTPEKTKKIFDCLKRIKSPFDHNQLKTHTPRVVKAIYEYNMYEFTIENILFLMKIEFKDEELLGQNYTLLSQIPDSPVYERIQFNIDSYLFRLTNKVREENEKIKKDEDKIRFKDDFEPKRQLLTSKASFERKVDYIENLAPSHRELDIEIWTSLFDGYRVIPKKYVLSLYKYQKKFEELCKTYRSELLAKQDALDIPDQIKKLLEIETEPESIETDLDPKS